MAKLECSSWPVGVPVPPSSSHSSVFPTAMNLSLHLLGLCVLLAACSASLDTSDDFVAGGDQDGSSSSGGGQVVLQVEHSLDGGDSFSPRGTLTLHSLRSGSATFAQDTPSPEQVRQMRSLCDGKAGGLYLLRMTQQGQGSVHRAVADACGMLDSGLNDVFTVHLDWRSQVVGVSVATPPPPAPSKPNLTGSGGAREKKSAASPPVSLDSGFRTKVSVQAMESGPQPDTAAFVQRQEQEKLAKQRGETKDNRSFFAKYWMYIVPVVIVMLMSSANPEAQGGGGGGR